MARLRRSQILTPAEAALLLLRTEEAKRAVAERDDYIKTLVVQGRSTREIARATGINHSSILYRLDKET